MSDATRAVALSEAVKTFGGAQVTADQALSVAVHFDNFLNSVGETAAPVSSAAGKEPTKVTTAGQNKKAPAAAAKKPAVSEDEVVRKALEAQRAADAAKDSAADETSQEATVEDVQAVIAQCLAANKRAEVLKVLKKYGATSATSVKKADIAKFVAEAKAILPDAEGAEDVDLTA